MASYLSEAQARAIGELVSEMVHSAEIHYLDMHGNLVYSQDVGRVNPGDTITAKVPEPEDFKPQLL